MPNAINLLKKDHENVKKLLSDLESTTARGAKKRQQLLDTIESELEVHTRIEEEIFYPAFEQAGRKEDDSELYFEAREEHRLVDDVLPKLKECDPGSTEFGGKATVLKDLVEHHAEEEEKEMFPRMRKLLSNEELEELGERMEERKKQLSKEANGARAVR